MSILPPFLFLFFFFSVVVVEVVGNPMQGSARGQAALSQHFTLPLAPSFMQMLFLIRVIYLRFRKCLFFTS